VSRRPLRAPPLSVQLDEFGHKFMRPRSHVSHHANNDNLTKKERKLAKQKGLYGASEEKKKDKTF
jgi:hypothetical protein